LFTLIEIYLRAVRVSAKQEFNSEKKQGAVDKTLPKVLFMGKFNLSESALQQGLQAGDFFETLDSNNRKVYGWTSTYFDVNESKRHGLLDSNTCIFTCLVFRRAICLGQSCMHVVHRFHAYKVLISLPKSNWMKRAKVLWMMYTRTVLLCNPSSEICQMRSHFQEAHPAFWVCRTVARAVI